MTKTIPLGEIVKIKGGGTPSRTNTAYWGGDIPWASVKDFVSTNLATTQESITLEGARSSATNVIKPGAIIVPTRMALGKAAINSVELAINQDLKALLPKKGFHNRFILHFILSKAEYLARQGKGATVKGIALDVLKSLDVPALSISEQRRIAEILDNADGIRRKRERSIALVNELMRATFIDMFGDPSTNPKKWPVGRIRDLVQEVSYGTSKRADSSDGEYPVLRMGNITYFGDLDVTELKFSDFDRKEQQKYLLKKDDILFNRTNSKDLVGKTAVFDLEDDYAFAGYLVRARVNHKADPYYISGYLNSAHGKSTLRAMCKSIIGMANINAQEFQDIWIAVPPIEIQKKYRSIVDRAKEHRGLCEAAAFEATAQFNSLSQRAFEGSV